MVDGLQPVALAKPLWEQPGMLNGADILTWPLTPGTVSEDAILSGFNTNCFRRPFAARFAAQ